MSSYKKSNKKSLQNLVDEASKMETRGGKAEDGRYWQPEADKAGNGRAVIRFLIAPDDEDFPWARYWQHGFKGANGWYIENCPTTIGKNCPLCEHNNTLWNSEVKANEEIARKQKRKLYYVSNILVVDDPANKDNNGKVFLFRYGKKIWEKIHELMVPVFEDEVARDPFDMDKGANFNLRFRKKDGYRNYDKSSFDDSTPVAESEDEINAIWNQEYSLLDILDHSNFKSHDQLSERLSRVLGNVTSAATTDDDEVAPPPKAAAAKAPKTAEDEAPWDSSGEDTEDDDNLKFFQELAKDEDDD
jgi:hypothetical protein